MQRKIVGIDLGTTNSAIAHFDSFGKPDIISNSDNERTTPSVVLFEDGEAVVGRLAKNLAVSSPDKVVQFVKRRIGEVGWTIEIDGHAFSAEVLSAMILKRLVNDAEQQLGQQITDVVITCPAYFNDNERRQTREAGRIAGLNVLGILNESTAAAIAYGLNNLEKEAKAVVFDLGGGTLDVTVLHIQGNSVRVLATDGERRLGGKDWDDVLIERVAEEFYVLHGIDPREDAEAMQDLIIRCEDAKKALTSKPRTKVFIQCGGHSLKAEITREDFEKASRPLLKKAVSCLERTLAKAHLVWSEVDTLLLVGGSTRMPVIRKSVERVSGLKCDQWINPDECVAIGAAYWAAILLLREAKRLRAESGELPPAKRKKAQKASRAMKDAVPEDLIVILDDMEVRNVNSHSLGILAVAPDGKKTNRIMIPEQTPIPHRITREFVTQFDNQESVEIRILEGASKDPSRCVDIGTCTISDLPHGRPKGSKIKVTYLYREDGVIGVLAKDVASGRSVKTQVKANAGQLSEEEIALSGRKVSHLLQKDVTLKSDSDDAMYAEFSEGLGE